MRKTGLISGALVTGLTLSACGGGGTTDPNPNPNPNPNPSLRTKLAACPVLSNSSDPSAQACLAGTYAGKTPANADCSVTIQANGSYSFTSPNLSYSYTPSTNSIRLFTHGVNLENHVLVWGISDLYTVENGKDLTFKATFGPQVQSSNSKIEIEAIHHLTDGGMNSASCTLSL